MMHAREAMMCYDVGHVNNCETCQQHERFEMNENVDHSSREMRLLLDVISETFLAFSVMLTSSFTDTSVLTYTCKAECLCVCSW